MSCFSFGRRIIYAIDRFMSAILKELGIDVQVIVVLDIHFAKPGLSLRNIA